MRRQSVAFFLGDVGFLSDPKFRKLARRLSDPDDFNSAVGAYFIALAAARRNGLPDVDVVGETDSRFVGDLMAVGLVTETGFPGKAFGSWKPSRPPYPGESSRNARTDTNGHEMHEWHGSHISSTPLLSTPLKSESERNARDEPFSRAIDYIEDRSGRPWQNRPGSKVWDTLDADLRDFGLETVIATMTTLDGHRLDHGQLVFGASRRLHPIEGSAKLPSGKTRTTQEAEDAFNQ